MLTVEQVLSGVYDWFLIGQRMPLTCPPGVDAIEQTDLYSTVYSTNGLVTRWYHG